MWPSLDRSWIMKNYSSRISEYAGRGQLRAVRTINDDAGSLAMLHPLLHCRGRASEDDGHHTHSDEQDRHEELVSRVPAFLLRPEL
jgi:hypothetical protein